MLLLETGTGGSAATLDPIYADFRDQTRFWIQRVAVPLIMVIGLFGNLITIIIMTRRRMRSTTNLYLAALAFVDMLYLILTFLLGLSHYPNMASNKYYTYWKLVPFLMMLTDACSNTSVWLTVTFTIERYIAVKYPMKGKVWCTEARAKKLIVGVFVLGILFVAPVPFEWKVVEKRAETIPLDGLKHELPPTNDLGVKQVGDELSIGSFDGPTTKTTTLEAATTSNNIPIQMLPANTNVSSSYSSSTDKLNASQSVLINYTLTLEYTEFGRNETYKTVYYWATAIIFCFIPLFSLMLFNGFLIKSVHESRRERTKMTTRQSAIQLPNSATTQSTLLVYGCDSPSLVNSKNDDAIRSNDSSSSPDEIIASNDAQCKGRRQDTSIHSIFTPSFKPKLQSFDTGPDTRSDSKAYCNTTAATTTSSIERDLDSSGEYFRDERNSMLDNSANNLPSIKISSNDTPSRGTSGRSDVQSECDSRFKFHDGNEMNGNNIVVQTKQPATKLIGLTFQVPKQDLNGSFVANPPESRLSLAGVKKSLNISHNISVYQTSGSQHLATLVPATTQERRITIMLIAVVILFLICQIPSGAMLLYTSVHEAPPNTNEEALIRAFGNICNFLMAVNAAGNFILYSFLSKKYRKTFMIIFCSCLNPSLRQHSRFTRPNLSSRYTSSSESCGRNNTNSTITGGQPMSNACGGHKSNLKVKRDTPV